MRLISSLLKSIFFIILGYWLAVSQVASGTPIGDGLDWLNLVRLPGGLLLDGWLGPTPAPGHFGPKSRR